MNKRYFLVLLILVTLLITGCSSVFKPYFIITVDPNPITLSFGDDSIDVAVEVTAYGPGTIRVDSLLMLLLDDKGIELDREEKEINKSGVVLRKIAMDTVQEISLPADILEIITGDEATYSAELKGKVFILELAILGSAPTTQKTKIHFQ